MLGTDPGAPYGLVAKLQPIFDHWQHMEEGSPGAPAIPYPQIASLYASDGSMHRAISGGRDWDVNLDGVAHYGLIPDLLQDLRNLGLPESELDSLYRSAEDYIRVWERCLARMGPLQP